MITYKVKVKKNGDTLWYNEINQLHRLDGPAYEYADGDKFWYQNGRIHRLDGPAIERSYVGKEWWVNGQRHRLDGPAAEWDNGKKEWWIEGKKLIQCQDRIHESALCR